MSQDEESDIRIRVDLTHLGKSYPPIDTTIPKFSFSDTESWLQSYETVLGEINKALKSDTWHRQNGLYGEGNSKRVDKLEDFISVCQDHSNSNNEEMRLFVTVTSSPSRHLYLSISPYYIFIICIFCTCGRVCCCLLNK